MELDLHTREFEFRAKSVDFAKREIVGTAVPYNQDANIGGYYIERFAQDAVQDSDDAILFYRHGEPVGRVTSNAQGSGWEIVTRVSETTLGNDALILARDGVIGHFSVGFEQGGTYEIEERDGELPIITRTKVRVREVSLVPFPAYEGAQITHVREDTTATQEATRMNQPNPAAPGVPVAAPTAGVDPIEFRQAIETLERRFDVLALTGAQDAAPILDTRSAGQLLKDIVDGDEAAISLYNDTIQRAYTGGTTADTIARPAFVGDLTRIIEEAGVLAGLFSTGVLPEEGLTLEYGQLKADTTQVGKQAAEGDDLPYGGVTVEVKNAPIETYGGYSRLSFQKIQRSTVNILDVTLRALAARAGRAQNAALRAFFATQVAAQITALNTVSVVDKTKYVQWVGAIVDAAEKYTDLGLPLDNLIVDKTEFKNLAALTASDGRPLMTVYGSGTNVVGEIDAKAIGGNLAGVPVKLNPKQVLPGAAFTNHQAIRAYNSPVARLQDENIINLSKDFSLYFYSARAAEIPAAIVPVKFGA